MKENIGAKNNKSYNFSIFIIYLVLTIKLMTDQHKIIKEFISLIKKFIVPVKKFIKSAQYSRPQLKLLCRNKHT